MVWLLSYPQVLAVLVRAVVEGITDSEGQSAARLRPKVLELFGRITSKVCLFKRYSKVVLIEYLMTSDEPSISLHSAPAQRCVGTLSG